MWNLSSLSLYLTPHHWNVKMKREHHRTFGVKRDTSALGWQKWKSEASSYVCSDDTSALDWQKWKSEASSHVWTETLSVDQWPTYGMSAWKMRPYHFFTFAFWRMSTLFEKCWPRLYQMFMFCILKDLNFYEGQAVYVFFWKGARLEMQWKRDTSASSVDHWPTYGMSAWKMLITGTWHVYIGGTGLHREKWKMFCKCGNKMCMMLKKSMKRICTMKICNCKAWKMLTSRLCIFLKGSTFGDAVKTVGRNTDETILAYSGTHLVL